MFMSHQEYTDRESESTSSRPRNYLLSKMWDVSLLDERDRNHFIEVKSGNRSFMWKDKMSFRMKTDMTHSITRLEAHTPKYNRV